MCMWMRSVRTSGVNLRPYSGRRQSVLWPQSGVPVCIGHGSGAEATRQQHLRQLGVMGACIGN